MRRRSCRWPSTSMEHCWRPIRCMKGWWQPSCATRPRCSEPADGLAAWAAPPSSSRSAPGCRPMPPACRCARNFSIGWGPARRRPPAASRHRCRPVGGGCGGRASRHLRQRHRQRRHAQPEGAGEGRSGCGTASRLASPMPVTATTTSMSSPRQRRSCWSIPAPAPPLPHANWRKPKFWRNFRRQSSPIRDWIRALRMHQWSKNALLFVPLRARPQAWRP